MDRIEWLQKISKEIFTNKYMLHGEEDPINVLKGVAKEISLSESPEKQKQVEELFFEAMATCRFIPGGRVLANARPDSPMKNYNNCFTIDIEDSMEGIYHSLKEDALISKVGGGVGFDISKLRPKDDKLSSGGRSSGVISFLRIFDQSAKTIITGGQRRSAHIALLDISHPDIEEFITIKQGDSNKELTQFNISVKITDEFIKAVEADSLWDLTFGGKVYKTVKARDLYERLCKNAYIHNEPGIFNADTVERYNNGWYSFKMDRCNPCGEIVMPAYSLCCLGALNLSMFVKNPFEADAEFDFENFKKCVATGVRFLDNVLDRTIYPLEKIETFSRQWRRIGLGITALGDALAMLRVKYGEPESLDIIEKIGEALRDGSYSASADLAKEKGPFPACDKEKLLQSDFIKKLPENIKEKIGKYGLRNIQLNTIAPTGTTSLSIGQNCSSGIEPVFALQYDRNIRSGAGDETYKETVYDYAWLLYTEKYGKEAEKPDYMVTTMEIDPYNSINVQSTLQKYIDHSISKTLNLPPNTSFEEYQKLFMYAYKKGLKGFTTFNPTGSMKGVLEYADKPVQPTITRHTAPDRPKELPCEIHSIKVKGTNYIIIVGFLNGSLYELFVIDGPEADRLNLEKFLKGVVKKEGKGRFNLIVNDDPIYIVIKNFTKKYNSPNASLARFISMALRHGTPLPFIIEQLSKDTNFVDCERGIARVLKNYLVDGEEIVTGEKICPVEECGGKLTFRDGCVICSECGWSKCS